MLKGKNLRRVTYIGILILSVMYIIIYINISLGQDEDFTMSIVKHTYSHIIYLDSLDVHPPLYYFILKLFLQITTFWTKSIFIKILFARFPSLIFSGITFLSLIKIVKLSGYKVNVLYQYLAFLMIPTLMLYSTQIRMYSLVTMFISLEFYELLKLDIYPRINLSTIVLILLFSDGAAYSHYFGAISAGLFLLIFASKFIYIHKIKQFLYLLLISLLCFIFYIPWMFIIIKQANRAIPNTVNNINILKKYIIIIKELFYSFVGAPSLTNHIFSIIFLIPLFIFFIVIYFEALKLLKHTNRYFRNIFLLSFLDLLLTIFFGESLSIITHPFYCHRYVYPIFVIVMFLIFNLLIINKSKHKNIHKYILIIIMLLIINGSSAILSVSNCFHSVYIYNNITSIYKSPSKKVYARINGSNNSNATHLSIYLSPKNKYIITNKIYSRHSFGRPEPKLFKQIYSNIKSRKVY